MATVRSPVWKIWKIVCLVVTFGKDGTEKACNQEFKGQCLPIKKTSQKPPCSWIQNSRQWKKKENPSQPSSETDITEIMNIANILPTVSDNWILILKTKHFMVLVLMLM